jgi:predicted PurR-regulated permease PerM
LIETSARHYFGPRYPQAEDAIRTAWDVLSSAIPSLLAGVAQSLWNQGSAAFNFGSIILVTPIVFFYALLDWPTIAEKLDTRLPCDNADEIRALALEIDNRISAFIRGQGVVCLILAHYYAGALSLAGLDYGLLVGLLTGLAAFIPVVGWSLGTVTALALAIVEFWPNAMHVVMVAGIMLGGQALIGRAQSEDHWRGGWIALGMAHFRAADVQLFVRISRTSRCGSGFCRNRRARTFCAPQVSRVLSLPGRNNDSAGG